MKKTNFKRFREMVETEPLNNQAPIWYADYLWLDLTDKQAVEISHILIDRGCPIFKGRRGFEVRTPSGLGIILPDLSI